MLCELCADEAQEPQRGREPVRWAVDEQRAPRGGKLAHETCFGGRVPGDVDELAELKFPPSTGNLHPSTKTRNQANPFHPGSISELRFL